jgi:nitrogen fixation-related uncharacterized protein
VEVIFVSVSVSVLVSVVWGLDVGTYDDSETVEEKVWGDAG